MNSPRKTFIYGILFLILFSTLAYSNNFSGSSPAWTINPFAVKYFIENKGQFNGKDLQEGTKILYGVDDMGIQVYFKPGGLTYCLKTTYVPDPNSLTGLPPGQEEDEEEHVPLVYKTDPVSIEWLNSNPDVEVLAI